MQADNELAQAFRAEFQALLTKYNAYMVATDEWQGYRGDGDDLRITVHIIHNKVTKKGKRIETTFDFGKYIDGQSE